MFLVSPPPLDALRPQALRASVTDAAASAASTAAGAGAVDALSSVAGALASSLPLLGSIGVLTLVIALHEAGHLVAALSQGIRVKAYSIGFGPRLLSYRSGRVDGASGEAGLSGLGGRLSGPSWDWGGLDERGEGRGQGGGGGGEGRASRSGRPRTGNMKNAAVVPPEPDDDRGVEVNDWSFVIPAAAAAVAA